MVEAYEMDTNNTRFVNLSTRGYVGTLDDAMIGGVIVTGGAKSVVIRALGPSLAMGSNALADVLSDPVLELHDGFGNLIAINDDWATNPEAGEILRAGLAPTDRWESAMLANLAAGNYTAVVRGFRGKSGTALVEVFDLDP